MEIITIAAIFIGPIAAVMITRWIDGLRDKKMRQMQIFKTLMATRREPMSGSHVGALNLIEIEFAGRDTVLEAWKYLFEHFGNNHPRYPIEAVDESMPPEEVNSRNSRFAERLYNERQTLLAKLLHPIAKEMKFDIEQLEIFEGGYTPQGWIDNEIEQRIVRQYLLDLYSGKRVVPVGVVDYSQGNRS